MDTNKSKIAIMLSTILVSLYGCKSTPIDAPDSNVSSNSVSINLPDFETAAFVNALTSTNSTVELESLVGVTNGKNALRINFDAVSDEEKNKIWPSVKIKPQASPWNWNSKGSLKLDVTNPSGTAINVIFKLSDNVGLMGEENNQLNYSATIPAGATEQVEMLFNGSKRKLENYWGGEKLNLRHLSELQVFVPGSVKQRSVVLDNFELVNATGDFISAEEKVVDAGPIPTLLEITDFSDDKKTFVSKSYSRGTSTQLVDTLSGQGLNVKFSSKNAYPNIAFRSDKPWDWSKKGDFNLALDIDNPTDDAVQLYVRIDQAENAQKGGTANGVKDSMSSYVTLLPGKKSTYYMALQPSSKGNTVSGMRSEPPKLSYDAQAISYGWGEKSLNTSEIHTISLYLQNPTKDAEIIVDTIRLVPDLSSDTSRYENIVDKYGQFTGDEWEEKIHSDEELRAAGKKELANIGKAKPLSDRCTYGGWSEGSKLEATGFFRTEKVDGQWTLVDPQGCKFFMTGLANIRMADTVTITGVDFDDVSTREGAKVHSELRNSMFEWLPEYSDPLAEAYSYAGYVHSGAVKKGEVYSFYLANQMRKYGVSKEEAKSIWKDVTLDRMTDWGFTTLGNWTDPIFFGSERVAYEAHGWIRGDHKRISTGNDYWGPIHDPFDPEFRTSARDMAERVASEVKDNDPWLVGTFVDNEISWGNVMNEANHYGLVINALSYDSAESPAKKAFSNFLKDKYSDISKLNSSWNVQVKDWKEFDKSFDYRSSLSKGMKEDYSTLLQMLSEQYFSTVRKEIKRVLPNHLYLGARFADWGVTPEIARGAAKYVDVMSYNLYANDLNDGKKAHWKKLLPELDKPSVIGEFHFGATDTGLFHGGIVSVAGQKQRAEMYTQYMNSIVDNPYFVGAHWFQYLDSPATGRAWDGENYNIGFVTVADVPYVELGKAAKDFNEKLYKKRFKK
ncbi:beta-galactosidase [Vibrio sp. 10N.286.49.F3]|uniref:beta-galactosidase n=1 Tax=unclassified Vibrio TaxID=2614977 RepID=UPI00354E3D81